MIKIKNFFNGNNNILDSNAKVYVCGPTTYDYPHIGNLRPLITFDVLNRLLSENGKINYVHNITDIDDKIINKALETNQSEKEVSEYFYKKYLEYMEQLNVLTPNEMPKVSEHIPGMVSFVKELIEKGFAYESNGSVYFSVKKDESYGKLANLSLSDMMSEEENPDKKDKNDFALWKATDKGIQFETPWGLGRPGWHTECAYFIKEFFGDEGIDLHGGGIDLKFPHHINEMTQYKALTGNELSKNWSYVGHLSFDGDKMSKSLGNTISVEKFIDEHSANTLRMLMYSTHYSKPLSINNDTISNAQNVVDKIFNSLKKAILNLSEEEIKFLTPEKDEKFVEIIYNDIDITNAITHIFTKVKNINENVDTLENAKKLIYSIDKLGLKLNINEENLSHYKKHISEKNYEEADKLREGILSW